MRRLTPPALLRAALALLALAAAVSAQAPVDARSALSSFPDSQAVLFINARCITTEAMPRLLPKAEYDKLIAQPRQFGFDVRDIDSIAVGARFADPAQPAGIPEVLIVIRGRVNANALLTMARVAGSTQNITPTEESYGGRTMQVYDLTRLGQPAAPAGDGANGEPAPPKPPPFPFKEVAALALDDNTLIIGVPAYVKAAVDAVGGQGRLKPSLLDLAARDPQQLWSLSAELPPNLAEYAQRMGVPKNAEAERVMAWLKQVSVSNGMDARNFTVGAAVQTDHPDHASALSGMVRMGMNALQTAAEADIRKKRAKPAEARQAQIALRAMRTFSNRTEGNVLLLGGFFPQTSVAEVVRKEFGPRKPAPKKTAPRATARRRSTRRR